MSKKPKSRFQALLLLIRDHLTTKQRLRIRELESILLRIELARDQLVNSIKVDASSKYVLFTDDEEFRQILPDNILILSSKFKQFDLGYSMEKMSDDPFERSKIELWLLKGVLKAPVLSDLITVQGDTMAVGGRKLSPQELVQVRSEIKVIQKMRITRLMDETLAENARKVMFENAKSIDDIKFGKTIFYIQDLVEKVYKIINRETLDEKMRKVVQLKK